MYYLIETIEGSIVVQTDERIVRLCHEGRQEGFALLLDTYQSRVYRRAYSFLRNREDALDAVQETFLRVLPALDRFRIGEPLWPWIRRITTNTCLNYIRSRQREAGVVPLEDQANELAADPADGDPEQLALIALDRELLNQALDTLPPVHRMVVVLRHEEGMSYDEIARTMNLPLGTVKTYLFRARRSLRAVLRNEVAL